MENKTDELLREFAEKYKTFMGYDEKSATGSGSMTAIYNTEELLSDLRTLIDKLMPSDSEILHQFNNDMGHCHTKTLQTRWQGAIWLLEWFRNRMKGLPPTLMSPAKLKEQ